MKAMSYPRPPWPSNVYKKFCELAKALGYKKRGTKWKLMDLMIEYAKAHKDLFRNRS